MIARSFDELARDLRQRRREGEPPPVLLLGAGASVGAGIGDMSGLMGSVGCADFDDFAAYIAPLTAGERYRLLAEFLQTQSPMEVTPGYRALATLCENLYFDLVLTTNLDPLLEDAISATAMRRRDWILLVNGVLRPDRIETILGARSPRLKVVKLHGDLFHRFMAWTPAEMGQWVTDIATPMSFAVRGRDLLVVGSSLRDVEIRELAMGSGGVVWFTTPGDVPDELTESPAVRAVTGTDAAFETLLPRLAAELIPEAPAVPAAALRGAAPRPPGLPEQALNLDDLMAAVVGVVGMGDGPGATGFLLADPAVIVTGSFGIRPGATTVEIVARDGRRLRARVIGRVDTHPLGPLVLEAPDALQVAGLPLVRTASRASLAVRVAVAAGERVGVSDGAVVAGRRRSLEIAPVGLVSDMVELAVETAGGASGAPVVDRSMGVRGILMAGSEGVRTSYMLPTGAWADAVVALAGATPPGRRRSAP